MNSFVVKRCSLKILISSNTSYGKSYIYSALSIHCDSKVTVQKNDSMLSYRSRPLSLLLELSSLLVPCYHHNMELHISQIIWRQQQQNDIILLWDEQMIFFLLEQKECHDCIQIAFVQVQGRARITLPCYRVHLKKKKKNVEYINMGRMHQGYMYVCMYFTKFSRLMVMVFSVFTIHFHSFTSCCMYRNPSSNWLVWWQKCIHTSTHTHTMPMVMKK